MLAAAACAALFLPAASSSPPSAVRRVEVSRDFAVQRADGSITVEARPLEGETPVEFARRVSKDDATAQRLLALPGVRAGTRSAVLSYAALSDESKRAAIAALFPSDVRATAGLASHRGGGRATRRDRRVVHRRGRDRAGSREGERAHSRRRAARRHGPDSRGASPAAVPRRRERARHGAAESRLRRRRQGPVRRVPPAQGRSALLGRRRALHGPPRCGRT